MPAGYSRGAAECLARRAEFAILEEDRKGELLARTHMARGHLAGPLDVAGRDGLKPRTNFDGGFNVVDVLLLPEWPVLVVGHDSFLSFDGAAVLRYCGTGQYRCLSKK